MLPQLAGGQLFVTDAGLETDLIFNRGVELPEFAAFVLLDDADGMQALREYFAGFVEVAREHDAGLILDTPTWRASRDWGEKLGYDARALRDANVRWVDEIAEISDRSGLTQPVVLNGVVGPRGDGYVAGTQMSADEAATYHEAQVRTFAEAGTGMVSAITMTYVEEAIGVARAAAAHGMPAVISFTVETDGRLPTGQPLAEAIDQVDSEAADAPAYFMVNCAHPTHFHGVLDGPWVERIRGVRANASALSHKELDAADELDDGDPGDLAARYVDLRERLPNMNVVGGCCGTDVRHVAAMSARLSAA